MQWAEVLRLLFLVVSTVMILALLPCIWSAPLTLVISAWCSAWHLSKPEDITLIHYIDDIMQIGLSEQEGATIAAIGFVLFAASRNLWDLSSPTRGSDLCPQQWKCRILSIGTPVNSPDVVLFFSISFFFFGCTRSVLQYRGCYEWASLVLGCGLSCPEVIGISVPQPGTEHVPWIGRQILNHWTTREVPRHWFLLVKHLCVREWEINPAKVQGLSVKFQRYSGVGHMEISLLKWRTTCGFWPLPQPTEEYNTLTGLLRFWKQHIPHLGVLYWPDHQVTWKAVSFEWDQDKRRLCNRSSCCTSSAALPCGPRNPVDAMVLKREWPTGMLFGVFGSLKRWLATQALRILEPSPVILHRWLLLFFI